jgi:PAS domain S-box-containing protein
MPMRRPVQRLRPAARTDSVRDAFFRHMVANMRNGVLAIARNGELVLINDEACRIFDLHEPSYIGRPYVEVLRSHPDMLRIIGGVFELSALPNRAEIRLKSTGTVIGYTLSLVRNDDDEVVGAALFFKDLTYVEQMEERERLRDRLAAVGEMAAAVAHEIKNPLAGIEVMAGVLRRQVPDRPDIQSLVADIINEAKMANAIVQEVLDFVRPVRLELDRTSLSDALHAAVTMADGKAKRGLIAVSVNMSPSLPCIEGDRHQLTQLFANLLINAYEALDGRGAINLGANLAETESSGALLLDGVSAVPSVIVEVSDTGPGVSTEVADKMFKPFFTTKPQGSGLGLAIVRKIVDAHEGRIDFRSTAGSGTTFRVTLPVVHTQGWGLVGEGRTLPARG